MNIFLNGLHLVFLNGFLNWFLNIGPNRFLTNFWTDYRKYFWTDFKIYFKKTNKCGQHVWLGPKWPGYPRPEWVSPVETEASTSQEPRRAGCSRNLPLTRWKSCYRSASRRLRSCRPSLWPQESRPAFTVHLSLNLPWVPWDLRQAEPSSVSRESLGFLT